MNAPRKLAAILAADIAGYSRLMGIDEVALPQLCVSIRSRGHHREETS
jgi:hypothetical protein